MPDCNWMDLAKEVFSESDKPFTDAELKRLVGALSKPELSQANQYRFEFAGARVAPYLAKALANRAKFARRFGKPGEFHYPPSPLDQVCSMIDRVHLPDVVAPLAKYLELKEPAYRKAAATALARLAAPETIAPTLRALDDPSDEVVEGAIMGIAQSVNQKSFDKPFLVAIFPGLVKVLARPSGPKDRDVPKLLLKIDRRRAIKVLRSAEVISFGNPYAAYSLSALNAAHVKVGHELLMPFLEAAKPREAEGRYFSYCSALIAYGANPDGETEALLRAELKSPHSIVRYGASQGLAALAGAPNPLRFCRGKHTDAAFKKWTKPQRNAYVATCYESEVYNGGVMQYFDNSAGARWKELRVALKAIGAVKHAAVFEKALAVFAPEKPRIDHEERREQTGAFSEAKRNKLHALTKQYNATGEEINVLVNLYAAKHPEHFRK